MPRPAIDLSAAHAIWAASRGGESVRHLSQYVVQHLHRPGDFRRPVTRRAIEPERLARQGIFRPELPQAWYRGLASGKRDTAEALWTLVAFQAWCERFGRASGGS